MAGLVLFVQFLLSMAGLVPLVSTREPTEGERETEKDRLRWAFGGAGGTSDAGGNALPDPPSVFGLWYL